MSKTELFHEVLSLVSEVTEITQFQILSESKSTETVDARSLLVNILIEQGLYPVQIAVLLNRTPTTVRNLINNFYQRKKNNLIIERYWQELRKRAKNKIYPM